MDLRFKTDESAAEGLTMRVLVTVILFCAILGLSIKAGSDFINEGKEKKLLDQLDIIEKDAAIMYTQGGARDIGNPADVSGTIEKVPVIIPDNAAFVVFGGLPAADGKPSASRYGSEDNVFYYVLTDGRTQTDSSIARFSANVTDLDKPFVLYPGEYELTLELVKNKNGTYVRIE
ncbi:MAG: hypothetical protein J5U17_05355 [Candidatus Methanoperedens sp.]|nr:hypothetical protein [Candidatus Methanoperedens sp.]